MAWRQCCGKMCGVGKQKNQKDSKCTPSVTITAPDGKMKILVPSQRQQRHLFRLISSVLAVECILCVLMISLEAIILRVLKPQYISYRPGPSPQTQSTSMDSYHYYVRTCRIGSGIWAGCIGLICFGVGIGFMMARMNCLQWCTGRVGTWRVVYGSIAFLCSIVDAILVASVSMCIYGLNRATRVAERRASSEKRIGGNEILASSEAAKILSMLQTTLAMDSALITFTILHIIVVVASVKILRRGWSDENYQVEESQEQPPVQLTLENSEIAASPPDSERETDVVSQSEKM